MYTGIYQAKCVLGETVPQSQYLMRRRLEQRTDSATGLWRMSSIRTIRCKNVRKLVMIEALGVASAVLGTEQTTDYRAFCLFVD